MYFTKYNIFLLQNILLLRTHHWRNSITELTLTLCCISLCMWLETRIIIKSESHPFYPENFDWFSWGWAKFFNSTNSQCFPPKFQGLVLRRIWYVSKLIWKAQKLSHIDALCINLSFSPNSCFLIPLKISQFWWLLGFPAQKNTCAKICKTVLCLSRFHSHSTLLV